MDQELTYLLSSEYVLNVPPSPSLSARRMIRTYLTVTIMKRLQMISDNAPIKSCRDGAEENVEEYT